MGVIIPNGYGIYKPTLTLDGSTKIFQTAVLFKNDLSSPPVTAHAAIRGYWTTTGAPHHAAQMYIGYTLAYSECYTMLGGVLYYDLNNTPVVGTKASSAGTPINTSIIVRKLTGVVGKRYRGRIMLPNTTVAEGNISQAGIIDSTGLGVVQGQYTPLFNSWSAGSYPPYLGHSVSEVAPTAIIGLEVNSKVGSMPHRIRGF